MGRRSEKFREAAVGRIEPTAAREALERRWFKLSVEDDALARLVTAADAAHEPFHRWMPYTQGYSPALVRYFLETARPESTGNATKLLDPFSGSGTFAIECGRHGHAAIGVDAIAALAFLTEAAGARSFPPLPNMSKCRTWQDAATILEIPIHRATLMLAVARMHNAKGDRIREAAPLPIQFNSVVRMIREDLAHPLPTPPQAIIGDARDLASIKDNSIAGILTSPPYLSRHNYSKITRPLRRVYSSWANDESENTNEQQITADVNIAKSEHLQSSHPAIAETCTAFHQHNLAQSAIVVQNYFADMNAAVKAMHRVLDVDAPCWIVVGGARVRDVYVPADLILAEFAKDAGFYVERITIARRLIKTGRKLGDLSNVAPRESILELRKTG